MKTPGLLVALLVAAASPAAAQVPMLDIDLRVGVNSTSFSESPSNAHENWFVGGDIRFGGPFFIQPGLYYQKQGFELEAFNQDIGVSSFMIPVQVGYNLSLPFITVEAGVGPTVTFNSSSDGVRKDDLNNTRFGGMVSGKVRVLMIGAFVGYQFDFTDTFDGADGTMSQWMLGLGINF